MKQTFNPKKTLECELEVGSFLTVENKSFPGIFQIAYAGMPSKEAFSMIYAFEGAVANMFFPISKKEINLYKKRFEVLNVDAEKIKLKYLGEK